MRIGLFGGSFDPLHIAHIKLARAALRQLKLDRVNFVLAKHSPFKLSKNQTSPFFRWKMLKRALASSATLVPVDWELKRKGPSYTVSTVRNYKKNHPKDEIFLIMGSDAYKGFSKWRGVGEIRSLCTLVVGHRRSFSHNLGVNSKYPARKRSDPGQRHSGMTVWLRGIFPDISSTTLRKKLKLKHSMKRFLPPSVEKFIRSNNLYQL